MASFNIENSILIRAAVRGESHVEIPGGIYRIGAPRDSSGLFHGESFESVTIPNGVTEIGAKAFINCSNLKKVILPETLEIIEDQAFAYCGALEEIVFPTSLRRIGVSSFFNCRSLTSVEIPSGVQSIGSCAFAGCEKLTQVHLRGEAELGDGVFVVCPLSGDENGFFITGDVLRRYCGENTEVTVPSGVRVIDNYAFTGQNITGIHLPDTVERIGDYAFRRCRELATVRMSENLKYIGVNAFADCRALTSVTLPDSLTQLEIGCFSGCLSLTELHLPKAITSIPMHFCGGSGLTTLKVPETVTSIEMGAFANCQNLQSVALSKPLQIIHSAFFGCKSLPYLLLPEGTKVMGSEPSKNTLLIPAERYENLSEAPAFSDANVLYTIGTTDAVEYKIVFSKKLRDLGTMNKKGVLNRKNYDHFLSTNEAKIPAPILNLAMLCRLRWPIELEESKKTLFIETLIKNIKKVAVYANLCPEDGMISTLEEIGALTDKNKKALLPLMGIGEVPKKKAAKSVSEDGTKTPAQLKKEWNVKKLEDGTLRLTSYKGTDTVIEIPAAIGKDPVSSIGAECLTCGVFSRASEEQIAQREKITSVIIPEGITEICDRAFFQCKALESVTFPSTIKTIGEYAFAHCAKLKGVSLPKEVSMERGVFTGCSALADESGFVIIGDTLFGYYADGNDVEIPAHIKRISDFAFWQLPKLTSVTFPQGLKSIPPRCIYDCRNLKFVTIPPSVTDIASHALPSRITVRGYTDSAADQFCRIEPWISFVSIGVLENKDRDFVIHNSVLKEYKGDQTEVIIPEGVEVIESLCNDRKYWLDQDTHLSRVERLVIPEGVRLIGYRAFAKCTNLREIVFPESLEYVDHDTLEDTPWLKAQGDGAVYAGRCLYAYTDVPDCDTLTVRDGTLSVSAYAFRETIHLKKVILPQGLKRIGDLAFSKAKSVEELVIPASVTDLGEQIFGYDTVKKCSGDVLHKTTKLPAAFKIFYGGAPEDTAWLALYQQEPSWRKAIREQMDAKPDVVDHVLVKIAELLNAADPSDKSVGNRAAAFALDLFRSAGGAGLKAVYDVLNAKKHPAVKKLDANEEFKKHMEGNLQEDLSLLHPTEAKVAAAIRHTKLYDEVLSHVADGVHYVDSDEICARRVLAFVAYEYIRQYDPASTRYISDYTFTYATYQWSVIADEAASALNQRELLDALGHLARQYEGAYYLPYARYADDKNAVTIISQMREWDNWSKYAAVGRKNIIIARSGLLLNDTKAAMIYLEKTGFLNQYAALRNIDPEVLRDTVIAQFGFDENRELRYDLGGNTVVVRIDDELNLTLFDTNAGKTVKSIPKKGADATLHEKAKSDFSELKKNIKKILTNRRHLLFAHFLSGIEQKAERWKQSYIGNPVLNSIARLVVWAQEGKTFTLTAEGAIDSAGDAYRISDQPISVAHPIEMRHEIAAWQNYFASNGLKQPFEQVWEPAYDPAEIQSDRYDGCRLNVYRLANKEEHGIRTFGISAYSEEYGFELTDCDMEYQGSEWRLVSGLTDDATFNLGSFTFEKFTRYVNHIVYMFDKWTITERLLMDDVSALPLLSAFNAAQIREFIRLTSEKGCVNAAAMLLEYQNRNFSAFDPLEEFTLDL